MVAIYHGLRAVDSDPFTVATRIREVLEPLFYSKFLEAYEKASQNEGSSWKDIFFDCDDSVIPEKWRISRELYRVIEDLHQSRKSTFSELDFGYDVTLYQNSIGEQPLVLVFGEKASEYRDALTESEVVTEYGYWNNADPDEDVTEEEWARRESAWKGFVDDENFRASLSILMPTSLDSQVHVLPPIIWT